MIRKLSAYLKTGSLICALSSIFLSVTALAQNGLPLLIDREISDNKDQLRLSTRETKNGDKEVIRVDAEGKFTKVAGRVGTQIRCDHKVREF